MADVKTVEQLIAEYEAAGGTVDRSGSSTSSTSTVTTTYPLFSYTLPEFNYKAPTLEELLLEAQQLYSGGYERQRQAAQTSYDQSLQDLGRSYEQGRQDVLNAATARGFGRSSYVTDALSQSSAEENLARERYAGALAQQLSNLDLERENQISSYASSKYREGQDKLLELEMLKAELELELQKLAYQSQVNKFQYDQQNSASPGGSVSGSVYGSSSGYGGRSSSSSYRSSGSSSGSSRSSRSSSSSSGNSSSGNPYILDNTLYGNKGYGQTMLQTLSAPEIIRDYGADFYYGLLSDVQGPTQAKKSTEATLEGIRNSGYTSSSSSFSSGSGRKTVSSSSKSSGSKTRSSKPNPSVKKNGQTISAW